MLWLLPVGILAISSAAILIRLTPADPVAITFWRLAFATAIVLMLGSWRGLGLPRGRALMYSALSGVLLAVHFLSWIPSLFLTTVAASTTLVNIHPVLMLFLSRRIGERVGGATAAGVLLAVVGSIFITFSPGGLLGNVLALVGAASFAGYLALGRVVRASVGTLGYAAVAYGVAALISLVVGLSLGSNMVGYNAYVFVMFLLIASIPMMLGHTVFNFLLGRYRAVTIAASTLGEPVGATLLAIPILGEVPRGAVHVAAPLLGSLEIPLQALGVLITLLGLVLVIREELKSTT
ncbi:DMT family transporter [Pyrobaculum sp. 3827-6]|uniref:DMT family transporter n=1 Tax=Pyrobaculum sp. 3827-6 TaxID=2983604 RepID=UPI0021D86559|nr:DMT family transporter [Pyrobaculum sp. 3827-6]MCU7788050.1 DMT family transporter [Pyrobaculum sp. 3827-6]